MNKERAEYWLSQALDGELSPRRQRRLEKALAKDPSLADLREQWLAIGLSCRAQTVEPPQTPEAAWQDVQRAIRLSADESRQPSPSCFGGVWRWSLSAAAVLMLSVGIWWGSRPVDYPRAVIPLAERTQVEWVESDLPDAISMVYEDGDTGITVIWVMMDDVQEDNGHAG